MESADEATNRQIEAIFDRCLRICEASHTAEETPGSPPPPAEARPTPAVRAKDRIQSPEIVIPFGRDTLKILGHLPDTSRRYHCSVPTGRFALHWEQTGRIVSWLFKEDRPKQASPPERPHPDLRRQAKRSARDRGPQLHASPRIGKDRTKCQGRSTIERPS